jgi:2-phosphoglycerate kinase
MSEKEPSVYIIGGLPRTGKSTVAERLAHDLHTGSMETDHIRMLFKPTPTSKIRSDSGVDIEVVTKKLRPRLESLIESLIQGGASLVLNGECIDPHMIAESPYREQINGCFMGLENPESAFSRIRAVATPNDWTLRQSDENLKIILEKYAIRSRALGKACLELNLPYVDASEDFMNAHEQAYTLLSHKNVIAY